MKQIVLIIIVAISLKALNAQNEIQGKRFFKTWIYLKDEPKNVYGFIYDVSDSAIVVSDSDLRKDYFKGNIAFKTINFKKIRLFTCRRNNVIARSLLIGALIGIGSGVAGAYISGDDPPCYNSGWFAPCFRYTAKQKAEFSAPVLGFVGAAFGVLGAVKLRIKINGDYSKFSRVKKRIKRRAVK